MNRKQAGTAAGKKAAPENLPIAVLVAEINRNLEVLKKRGIPVWDWDQKKRELHRIRIFGGKVYFLAAEQDIKI